MKRTLAILGVFFLLLRPFCDAVAAGPAHDMQPMHVQMSAELGAGSEEQGREPPCCASLGDGAVIQPGQVAAVRASIEGKLAFAAAWTLARDAGIGSNAASQHAPDVFPPPISFYARSARIRR